MKYLKINIKGGAGGAMIYPEGFQKEVGDFAIDHLYYEDGADYMLMLVLYDHMFNDKMIREGISEITETDAKQISETSENRTEIIKDEVKLRRIELMVAMGTALTKSDADSVDNTKASSLFGTTKILADKIDDHKTKEGIIKSKLDAKIK